MNNVSPIRKSIESADSNDLKKLRRAYRLSPTQAALALDVSPATVEAWERGLHAMPDVTEMEEKLARFATQNPSGREGKNLLFGYYPLRLARELLQLNVAQMASRFDYSVSNWTKIEANFRTLPPEVLAEIEEFVRDKLAEVCNP